MYASAFAWKPEVIVWWRPGFTAFLCISELAMKAAEKLSVVPPSCPTRPIPSSHLSDSYSATCWTGKDYQQRGLSSSPDLVEMPDIANSDHRHANFRSSKSVIPTLKLARDSEREKMPRFSGTAGSLIRTLARVPISSPQWWYRYASRYIAKAAASTNSPLIAM
jgi:hypothetical protein